MAEKGNDARKVAVAAFLFLTIFILMRGLFDEDFKRKHEGLLTAYAVTRAILIGLYLSL